MWLHERSHQLELLDLGSDFYTDLEYKQCQTLLFKINLQLGFFQSTLRVLKKISPLTSILDIGCGGGLFLLNLNKHLPKVQMLGIDTAPAAIAMANEKLSQHQDEHNQLKFQLLKDEMEIPANQITILNLVCHHIPDEQLIDFLKNALKATEEAIIINDLHRHIFAYLFYAFLSPILYKN